MNSHAPPLNGQAVLVHPRPYRRGKNRSIAEIGPQPNLQMFRDGASYPRYR